MYKDFSHAKKIIENCTEITQIKEIFSAQDISPYVGEYIEKYYVDNRSRRKLKLNQKGTWQDIYQSIQSKQDVINRQDSTERMIAEYQIKFERGDNKGYLETAVGSIEIEFSQYIIALRKLIDFNSDGHSEKYIGKYKCSVEEAKSFILASFKYHEKIDELTRRNMNMD
jgi:hypothetical protein